MLIQWTHTPLKIGFLIIVFLACFLAFLNQGSAKEKIIKIGVLTTPATGPASDVGANWIRGIKKAVEEINYRGGWNKIPLKTLVLETGDRVQIAELAAQRLIYNESVNVILSFSTASDAIAVSKLTEKNRTILLTPVASQQVFLPNSMYTFKIGPTDADIAKALVMYASDIGKFRKIALLTADRSDLKAATDLQKQYFAKKGLQPVFEQIVPRDQVDFSSTLVRIRNSNPDILCTNLEPPKLGLLLNQIHALSYSIQTINASTLPSYRDLMAIAGPQAGGHLSVSLPEPSKLGYESIYLLFNAFTKAGTYEDAEAIRKVLISGAAGVAFYDWGGQRRVSAQVVKFTASGGYDMVKDVVLDVPPDPPWEKN
jgi:branched-chain amino acid transport system substrate-binding protein